MADRRMLSIKIINSARFLKMPVSTQALYFHLCIRADDDGIVEGYNILRMTGATEDDLKILVAKSFIKVLNEDLVAYITDWNEHNKIRADRKIDSIYKDLLVQVIPDIKLIESRQRADLKKKNEEAGQPMDVQWTEDGQPMDGIGKDRIGKDRIGKVSNNITLPEATPYKEIVDLFNSICVTLPKVTELTAARKKTLNNLWKSKKSDIKFFESLFKIVNDSNFLSGRNRIWSSCCFDWTLQPKNLVKILEGNYDNRGSLNGPEAPKEQKKNKFLNFPQTKYNFDEIEQLEMQRTIEKMKKEGIIKDEGLEN